MLEVLHDPEVGKAVTNTFANSAAVSVPNKTWTVVRSVTLAPGSWIVAVQVRWASNTTGTRHLAFTSGEGGTTNLVPYVTQGADAGMVRQTLTWPIVVTAETTYNIAVYQNSGAALDVASGGVRAMRIA